ncbi:MAG: 50S ribosomal protein L34 [Candidatus Levybacteria bacterium RIFCSPLOWO2_01_FULL_38_13]|nr:MAG: 50S ribosomal protein L34 [Candidatus Levybacteria bacterium RIFCSPHIGHO2_01_FULL_41_15]OGH35781.1 MAG: 50S ribosomal protein L34 [Candidatus Levybacteria bacterium RIFCSPLOWO2_01_FULL_38_13]
MEKMVKTKRLKRKRKHGFLKRNKTRSGKKIIKRRRKKGRKRITV